MALAQVIGFAVCGLKRGMGNTLSSKVIETSGEGSNGSLRPPAVKNMRKGRLSPHLQRLEDEAIFIIREVLAEF